MINFGLSHVGSSQFGSSHFSQTASLGRSLEGSLEGSLGFQGFQGFGRVALKCLILDSAMLVQAILGQAISLKRHVAQARCRRVLVCCLD